jgi:hypothetical protein
VWACLFLVEESPPSFWGYNWGGPVDMVIPIDGLVAMGNAIYNMICKTKKSHGGEGAPMYLHRAFEMTLSHSTE